MHQYKRILVIAAFGIVGAAGAVYAALDGATFEWLSTDSNGGGITIGTDGDPGATFKFRVNRGGHYAWFTVTPSTTTPPSGGWAELYFSTGGHMMTGPAGNRNYVQVTAIGTSQLVSNDAVLQQPNEPEYAVVQAHYTGSANAISSADSAMSADSDGSAWMASNAGSSVTATSSGDVVIQLGDAPEEMMMMQDSAELEAVTTVPDHAERIAAIREEVEYDRPATED